MESVKHLVPPTSSVTIPVILISLLVTIGGGWIKDRLSNETRSSADTVRIENLEHQQEKGSHGVTREEFEQFSANMTLNMTAVRQDVSEIRRYVMSIPPPGPNGPPAKQ